MSDEVILPEINLFITEYKQEVNLTITESEDVDLSVTEDKEIFHLTIVDGEPKLNICITEGKDGKSAYESWLSLGNNGSEQDFIDSLKGDQGEDGGDKNYIHDQFNPSTVWNITHNLNKKPSVTVVDTAGTVVEGMVDYLGSTSQLKITFNYPFSGYATLN